MTKSSLEVKIAKWYLYLLPFRMITQLGFISTALHGAAGYFDFILHIIGLFLLISYARTNNVDKKPAINLLRYFTLIVVWCNISSIFMAIITQVTRGDYASESAFSGIVGMIIYFFQYVLIFYYNLHLFDFFTKEKVLKILNTVCILLMIIGYFQVAATIFPALRPVLENVDLLGILHTETTWAKVNLTTTEGASAGAMLSCFVFPLLYAQLINNFDKKILLRIILFLPILFFTHSTTAYITFFACTIIFIYYYSHSLKGIVLLIFVLAFVSFGVSKLLSIEEKNQISYLLFNKITDDNNGSTASRMIPLYINWGAFTESPLIGVGNGLQGYYFQDYFPRWALYVKGTDAEEFYERSISTIANGGVFFPGLLSGYGIIGSLLFLFYFIKSTKLVKAYKNQLGTFYYTYMIALLPIILTGFQGDFYGKYYLWFILSIPYMARYQCPSLSSNDSKHHEINC